MDDLINFLETATGSPWFFAVLFAVAAVDAFFPVVPSETVVITAGVFAAANAAPNLMAVIAVAALGAFVGDHVSLLIGRHAGGRPRARAQPGTKRRAAFNWAERTLAERGGMIIIVARYIPGGRTATTLTAGAVGYPLRRFSFFCLLAAVSWASYATMIGYLGGVAFQHDPVRGLLVGIGLALGVTVLVEVVRHVRRRGRARSAADVGPASEDGELVVPRR